MRLVLSRYDPYRDIYLEQELRTRLETAWRVKVNAQRWAGLIDTQQWGRHRTSTGGRIS